MKLPGKGESNYLSKQDVEHPIKPIMSHVAYEPIKGGNAGEKKYVLYFQDKSIKPMVLNAGNQKRLIAGYGDDTDAYRGREIEIYVDPNVEFAGEIIGGLRVRVPTGTPHNPAPVTAWTLDQCIKNCWEVGISRDEMVAFLKSKGSPGFNMIRDTPLVQQLIASKTPGDAFEIDPSPPQQDIPF